MGSALRYTDFMQKILVSPFREYIIAAVVALALVVDFFTHNATLLLVVSIIGALPIVWKGLNAVRKWSISIDTFNTFALAASFFSGEKRSAAFIVLMLTFASVLEWFTQYRARSAVEELLKLKPLTALREKDGVTEEISVEEIKKNDTIVVKIGSRIPVDGIVVYGEGFVNEASVTGESKLVEKIIGDEVLSSTLSESGAMKIRATNVGKESTIERMIALVNQASASKSHSEKLADRFAGIFLPIVALLGLGTYLVTRNMSMVIAFFLVACADDMAVAIPLAITAALGRAARRGVIIKGGEWLDVLGKLKILVLDKTGTLTYGELSIAFLKITPGTDEKDFWRYVAVAEKFSEHPVGKALLHKAAEKTNDIPDPDSFEVLKGIGVRAKIDNKEVFIGNEDILQKAPSFDGQSPFAELEEKEKQDGGTLVVVLVENKPIGIIGVADTPRSEARESMMRLKKEGLGRVIMFTGDNEHVASNVASTLGIDEFRASMKPEDKLRELEKLVLEGPVGMVGDGINDAPSLARADVGIAMGAGGTAVAVEAADVVILNDDLARLPEIIALGRKTTSVIRGDMIIWAVTNLLGFALVFTGVAGPSLAALYNFVSDFFPLLNSARLFRDGKL